MPPPPRKEVLARAEETPPHTWHAWDGTPSPRSCRGARSKAALAACPPGAGPPATASAPILSSCGLGKGASGLSTGGWSPVVPFQSRCGLGKTRVPTTSQRLSRFRSCAGLGMARAACPPWAGPPPLISCRGAGVGKASCLPCDGPPLPRTCRGAGLGRARAACPPWAGPPPPHSCRQAVAGMALLLVRRGLAPLRFAHVDVRA